MKRLTQIFALSCLLASVLIFGAASANAGRMTRYGNWCGSGGSGRPIDAADAICKRHDKCYEANRRLTSKDYASLGSCRCDRRFLNEMRQVAPKLRRKYGNSFKYQKAMAYVRFMKRFFKMRKCIRSRYRSCRTKVKFRMTRVRSCRKILWKRRCFSTWKPRAKRYRSCRYKFRWGKGGR